MKRKPIVVRSAALRDGWHGVASFGRRKVVTLCGHKMPMARWIIGHDKVATCRTCVELQR